MQQLVSRGHLPSSSSVSVSASRSKCCASSALPARPTSSLPSHSSVLSASSCWRKGASLPTFVARAAAGGGDAYDNLFQSNVFKSEDRVKEFNSVVGDLMSLSRMASRFPDFDLAGKRMFLDKMEEASDRYKIFIKRLELSAMTDKSAAEYLRMTNAQMLEGGFTLANMFEGLTRSIAEYRMWVDQEEKASADPAMHQQFLKGFRAMWGQSALGRIDMNYMSKIADPQVVMRAQKDPQFWKCVKEISDNPSPEVMARWMDDPNLGPLVAEMWKSSQQGGMGGRMP